MSGPGLPQPRPKQQGAVTCPSRSDGATNRSGEATSVNPTLRYRYPKACALAWHLRRAVRECDTVTWLCDCSDRCCDARLLAESMTTDAIVRTFGQIPLAKLIWRLKQKGLLGRARLNVQKRTRDCVAIYVRCKRVIKLYDVQK